MSRPGFSEKDCYHGASIPFSVYLSNIRGIILAGREATKAYRNALCSCDGFRYGSKEWCQYSKDLSQMIYFLRNEVKPKKPGSYAYNLFHSLQNSIDQENKIARNLAKQDKTYLNLH